MNNIYIYIYSIYMSTWTEALKKWNANKPTWCIPRRGTADHAEVRALMNIKKEKPVPKTKPKSKAKPKPKPAPKAKPKPKPAPKATPNVEDCWNTINDIMNLTYSNRLGSKDFTEMVKRVKQKRNVFDIITGKDFYPTPLEYGKYIYDHGIFDDTYDFYDISAGLGSLSYEFIKNYKNIKSITMLDLEETFTDLLKCFEKIPNVKVINKNFFDYEFNFNPKTRALIACNPPYRAPIEGKTENKAWLFFLVKIASALQNAYTQSAYLIIPDSPILDFYLRNGNDRKEGDLFTLNIPKATKKRIINVLGIDPDDDIVAQMSFVKKVTGFKGITKAGKIRKSADAIMIRLN